MRFPEFTKEWEEHALAEYLDFKNGLNPDVKRIGRGLPFISVMDILADGTINYDSIRGKVEATEREIENFSVEKGDILFQRSSETLEDVGRANVYMDNRTAVYGGFVIRGRKIGDYNPLFFKYLLSTPLARKRTCRMGAGAQHFNIGQDGLSKISLCFPLMEEQNKIARLLSLIDERIATQNKIIEKLQSLIKGIAQNVARNNKPNIRLSECLECSSSTLQESDVCKNGTYPVYGANGIVGYLDNYNTEKEAVYIIKDGSGVGTVSYVTGKCSATGTLNTLQAKEGYSLQYLYYMLKVFNFEPYKTGMAIPHIYFKDYGKAKIFCPSYTEQLKYARLLSAIDNKLSAEQSILTDLSLQKQYLLRQMFI
ncbi:restriction endonuclease subunit S [Parabacteroides merdae]|uniref:restriction endonuclease subunit S n=1 Tax=Parabacteroides merdae TaxID=46503 RepID=UPI001D0917F7|nr:restriction endonuclease subunit S [Parabacteroides merdae]MCB6307048.1 restriction endonuclease subunit S [Parabacteroides merdae]MCI6569574.1 restriction endonuclease subunit S [Parabacteroides merdae]MDB8902425.1 restriction endonuclease subunit S [Parabacteroides merdae]MDB8905641.1 restriction endonuclease subunit S [Parabacteroides merdae]MDY5427032.1 restriction endonuclease subunit S [Parabacteroides merdae]